MRGDVGAIAFLKELGIDLPGVEEVEFTQELSDTGDLAQMMNLRFKDKEVGYTVSGYTDNQEKQDKRRLFVHCDSYSIAIKPFIESQFEESTFVYTADYDHQQILEYETDIFVYELVERKLSDLLDFCISFE